MGILRKLCLEHGKSQEGILEESERQISIYRESNIPESEKDIFQRWITAILQTRQEHYFKAGFKLAIEMLAECK